MPSQVAVQWLDLYCCALSCHAVGLHRFLSCPAELGFLRWPYTGQTHYSYSEGCIGITTLICNLSLGSEAVQLVTFAVMAT